MSKKIESTNGVKINVEDLGGTGVPVVFLHGWPWNHKMFEYQFIELPKHGYRCIGIDLRGFGDSDKPWDAYNYDTMADDVNAVLNALNIENATLVGFSIGGAISIHYMARHNGAHIQKLALLAAAAPCVTKRPDFPHGLDKSAIDGLIQLTYSDRPAMIKYFSQLFFHSPEKLSAEFNIWNLSLGLAASAYATIQCAVELRDADLRKDLGSIQTPTLILHGTSAQIIASGAIAVALYFTITTFRKMGKTEQIKLGEKFHSDMQQLRGEISKHFEIENKKELKDRIKILDEMIFKYS